MAKELTPKQIVAELDKHIIGQLDAKRAVAVAIRNRWRRQQLSPSVAQEVTPKNILMIGPTGVGKTEIARRLATLTGSPFVKVEATKFTEVGYHGRDVDAMIRDLLDASLHMVKQEMRQPVEAAAAASADQRLLDLLLPWQSRTRELSAGEPTHEQARDAMLIRLRNGELDSQQVDVSIETKSNIVGMLGAQGMQIDPEMESMFERLVPARRENKTTTVAQARQLFRNEEAEKLVDTEKLTQAAIERCEQSGIVFIDEIDKIASTGKEQGPDVSRQGVQRDLLPIVEGSTVTTRHGPVRTDHILFIAAGAFHNAKPSDLMPELQGRFPIRVELSDLTQADLVRILKEPRNALTYQQIALLGVEGVKLTFTADAIDAIAQIAFELNKKTQNIGARRLHTVVERVLDQISYCASESPGKVYEIDARYVQQRLQDILEDEDLSKFVL